MSDTTENTSTETTAATDTPAFDMASFMALAQQYEQQKALAAKVTAEKREKLQADIKALDEKKAALEKPFREAVATYQGLIKEEETAFNDAVRGILAERQEKAKELQELIAALNPNAKPATVAATKAPAADTVGRNNGVRDYVWSLLDGNPELTAGDLAKACEEHYGNTWTTSNSTNGMKIAWKKARGIA